MLASKFGEVLGQDTAKTVCLVRGTTGHWMLDCWSEGTGKDARPKGKGKSKCPPEHPQEPRGKGQSGVRAQTKWAGDSTVYVDVAHLRPVRFCLNLFEHIVTLVGKSEVSGTECVTAKSTKVFGEGVWLRTSLCRFHITVELSRASVGIPWCFGARPRRGTPGHYVECKFDLNLASSSEKTQSVSDIHVCVRVYQTRRAFLGCLVRTC